MSDPFLAGPKKSDYASSSPDRYDLMRRVAKYQRWVLLALLAQVSCNVLFMSGVLDGNDLLEILLTILSLIIAVFAVYSIFMLARELFSRGVAIACAVLTIVPLAGIIALLVVNQKATKYLQMRGVNVGLLGANPNSI